MEINIGIGEQDRAAIAEGLSRLLADTYTLYLKTHNFHWNVTGPMFNTLHLMFEGQYTELAVAVDDIAERIRALGFPAPGTYAAYAGQTAKSADFAGGRYAITDNLSASLYGAELKDIYRQYYLNTNYTIPLASDQSLGFDFNIYRTTDEGKSKAGDISNTTWSLAGAYTLDAHTFTLAYQQVHGDEPFDYIGFGGNGSGAGGDSIFLANSVQYSDFNGPGEKSWQARYDLNLASYGVPGLTFMLRYINGKDIDGTKVDSSSSYAGLYGEDGKHHETNLEAKYVVQSGPAKDLSFRIRQAWHRANADQGEGDQNEFRLIVDYPLSIL